MSINSRIEQVIENKGFNKNSFSVKTGILPQTLHHIVGGRLTKPSYDVISKILQSFPDINARWLILGEDNDKSINKNGQEVAGDQEKKTNHQKVFQIHFDRFEEFIKDYNNPQFLESLPSVYIPLPGKNSRNVFNFQIFTEDMTPSLQPFDWIGARRISEDIKDSLFVGQVYIIITHNQLLIKRLRSISEKELYWGSDNPAHSVSKMNISEIRALYLGEYLYSQNLNPKINMATLLHQIASADSIVYNIEKELESELTPY